MNAAARETAPAPLPPTIGFGHPFRWLGLGWRDLWRHPAHSLFYGICVAITGGIILAISRHIPWLFTAAISGFFLVAPMLATGIYELSRQYDEGKPANLFASMTAWKRNPDGFVAFATIALFLGTAWQLISVVLIAMFYKGQQADPAAVALDILRDPNYTLLFMTYMGIGGLLAAVMFGASVTTMPMLLDRKCTLIEAVTRSFNAVSDAPHVMALWAALILILTLAGFATLLVGLVIIMPWLGHASWYAYKDLVPE
jgi:uncharacterized membrane protein